MKEVKTYLPEWLKVEASKKAKEKGVSLATYIRILLLKDIRIKENA